MFNISEIDQYIGSVKIDKSKETVRSYTTAIEKFIKYFNVSSFDDIRKINSLSLRKYQEHLVSCGAKNSSVNTYMRPLKAMFNWFIENEMIEKSPLSKVKELKEGKRLVTFMTPDEQAALISACQDNIQDRLIFALLLSTGLRRSELCQLNLNDFNGTHIKVRGKGNKERSLRLQDDVIKLMNEYISLRNKKYGDTTDALLVSVRGGHFCGDTIYKKIKSLLDKAGIPEERIEKIRTHTTRHSFVANMLDSGADIYVCQMSLGHENLETTMRYAHLHNKTLDNAMRNQKPVL